MIRFLSAFAAAFGLWAATAGIPAKAGPLAPPPVTVSPHAMSHQWNGGARARAPQRRQAAPIWRNRGLFTSSRAEPPSRFRAAPRQRARSHERAAPRYGAAPRSRAEPPRRQTRLRPARPAPRKRALDPKFLPTVVPYDGPHPAGTIIIDTPERLLYLVQADGTARRYGVGVGRPGFQWAGTHKVTRKAEWPTWTPPAEMRRRQPGLPVSMRGGPNNPLGARALYLGSTLYRIHGSNEPWTIGRAVSSGCIRMRNEDVKDLYARVDVGTRVVVN